MSAHPCSHAKGQSKTSGVFLCGLSLNFLEPGSLTNPESHCLGQLPSQWALGSYLFLFPIPEVTGTGSHAWPFMWVLEIWTQGLTLAGQVLLSTEPFPQPWVSSLHPYCLCNSKKRKIILWKPRSTQRKGLIPRLLWINSVKSSTTNNLGPTIFLYGKFSPYLIFHYSFWHPSSGQNEDATARLALPPFLFCHLAVRSLPVFPAPTQCWHFEVVQMRSLNLLSLLKIDNLLCYKPQAPIFNESFRWISKNYLAVSNILIRL